MMNDVKHDIAYTSTLYCARFDAWEFTVQFNCSGVLGVGVAIFDKTRYHDPVHTKKKLRGNVNETQHKPFNPKTA